MKLRHMLSILASIALALVLFLPARAQDRVDIGHLDDTCIATELEACVVLTSGRLNADGGDDDGASLLAWQTQGGFTGDEGLHGGFVLLEYEAGIWSVLDSGFDAYRFAPPRLGGDGTLLHVAGYTAGTGAFNADRLYQWGDSGAAAYRLRWNRIDIESWFERVKPMLPPGLEIWKGVDYDFSDWFSEALQARTPLWRPDDGNCCPSGGWATIRFEIDDYHILEPVAVDYRPPAKTK